jgi:hypothetical protein
MCRRPSRNRSRGMAKRTRRAQDVFRLARRRGSGGIAKATRGPSGALREIVSSPPSAAPDFGFVVDRNRRPTGERNPTQPTKQLVFIYSFRPRSGVCQNSTRRQGIFSAAFCSARTTCRARTVTRGQAGFLTHKMEPIPYSGRCKADCVYGTPICDLYGQRF